MPYLTLTRGLTITVPTNGTRNWGTKVYNETWMKISEHRHQGAGDGEKIPTAGLVDYAITTAKLSKNYGYTVAPTQTPAGTTATLNLDLGNVQTLDLGSATGNVTPTISNPQAGHKYVLLIIQAAVAKDIVWPSNCKFPQGQAPILTQTNDAVDKLEMYYNGTNFLIDWNTDYR